jgi:hypothetical protein
MKPVATMAKAFLVLLFMNFNATAWAADTFNSNKTDFETFTTGVSVNGQGGWVKTGPYDEEVVNDGGNIVWRVSNSITTGAISDQPFAPRPGGVLVDTVNDPVNSNPQFFAGESSTGADFDRFLAQFDFKSATGAPQPGLSLTVSPDNGQGARQGFVDILDNGAGLEVVTFDVGGAGGFIGPIVIASGLSYTETHSLAIEVTFIDGPANDIVKYFVNG